jgi:flagellar basal body-associated protein FliL
MANENAQPAVAAGAGKKGRLTPLIVVAAIMLGEGVAIFLLANAMSAPPAPVLAVEGGAAGEGGAGRELAEIELAECRPSNVTSGRFITFHLRVSALVLAKEQDRARGLVAGNQARIEDRVNVVIRSADPKELSEPGLETLRRRLKQELARVFNDDELIKQVLIPFMLQSGPGV